MQVEISLIAPEGAEYRARDLGFLLHKHPDHLHTRKTSAGEVSIFFPVVDPETCTAVLHLDIDPVGLVRGSGRGDGLLSQYVNDRPYVANSFLSVALAKSFGQSLSGKSKERQDLADRTLPYRARVTPVAVAGGEELVNAVFSPLGYTVHAESLADDGDRDVFDLTLTGTVRLRDLLAHLYVLVPVLDNAKHYWIDRDEVENLLSKGEGWLATHPEKELITRRALKRRPSLVHQALARLEADSGVEDAAEEGDTAPMPKEEALETPIKLHDLRLDTVMSVLTADGAQSVLDLGCGEGRLMARLIRERGVNRILGVDPSVRTLEVAARRLRLDQPGSAIRRRVSLSLGSLTYGDRRWHGFDAAALVEVIEHIDPPRLSAMERSVFGDARPRLVIITTPNREYNTLFETMPKNTLRHADHRFEWTRKEFETWAERVAAEHGYSVGLHPIGPLDETSGAPSQMAVFRRGGGEASA